MKDYNDAAIINTIAGKIAKGEENNKGEQYKQYLSVNGVPWVKYSAKDLAEKLPLLSSTTIKRRLSYLCSIGMLSCANLNKFKYDKSLWYSINYDESGE